LAGEISAGFSMVCGKPDLERSSDTLRAVEEEAFGDERGRVTVDSYRRGNEVDGRSILCADCRPDFETTPRIAREMFRGCCRRRVRGVFDAMDVEIDAVQATTLKER
jgi:hypothetical protein